MVITEVPEIQNYKKTALVFFSLVQLESYKTTLETGK